MSPFYLWAIYLLSDISKFSCVLVGSLKLILTTLTEKHLRSEIWTILASALSTIRSYLSILVKRSLHSSTLCPFLFFCDSLVTYHRHVTCHCSCSADITRIHCSSQCTNRTAQASMAALWPDTGYDNEVLKSIIAIAGSVSHASAPAGDVVQSLPDILTYYYDLRMGYVTPGDPCEACILPFVAERAQIMALGSSMPSILLRRPFRSSRTLIATNFAWKSV
jgi:hypothetical protein